MNLPFPIDPGDRCKRLLSLLFLLLPFSGTPSIAATYETNRAIEYYENGDYRRAKSSLSAIDISNDPVATYMMGAIALKEERSSTSSNLDTAISWFEISAKLNNPQAYHALGRTYEQRWLNERNLDDYESSKKNYELAINNRIGLAVEDLSRLVSSPHPELGDADEKRLNDINSRSYLAQKISGEAKQDSRASDPEPAARVEPVGTTDSGRPETVDNPVEKTDAQSSNLRIGAGFGVPYGIIGANINYRLTEAFDLTLGAGLGFGVGVRYHPLEDNRKYRLTLYYGANTVIDDPVTDKYETYNNLSIGFGYGAADRGWDIDLVYIFVSDEARDRIDELESLGYKLSSGDTDNTVKFSLGYHW